MASRPRIGAILRDGMRRKSVDQIQLAAAVGASRSAVNAWINDRSWPQEKYVAPLEEALDVRLPRWWENGQQDESPLKNGGADPNVAVLRNSIDGLSAEQQEELQEAYRRIVEAGSAKDSPRQERPG